MHRLFLLYRLLPFLLLVMLVSCAGQEPAAERPEPAKVVRLERRYDRLACAEFTTTAAIEKDYPRATETLRQSMIRALQEKKLFREVRAADDKTPRGKDTLLVRADIVSLRIVGDTARFWGGAFAGSSGVELNLDLVDAASGRVVRREKMSTWNNAFAAAWSWGASDHSLLEDMGVILADYIAASMPDK